MKSWNAEDWLIFFMGLGTGIMLIAFSVCMVFDCLVNYCHLRLW